MMVMNLRTACALAALAFLLLASTLVAGARAASFTEFDRKAKAGERLNVVFFGASLTWGANASDPVETSYRAVMRDRFEQHYPAAHFRFRDSAIGGTGSQLGAFRLDRDVLAHRPDLVFVDFTANDDIYSAAPETLASYESILRRLAAAGISVVQVAFPFKWDIETAKLPTMKRRIAHQALAEAYGNGWGDAVTRICREVDAGRLTREALWVTDGVHPVTGKWGQAKGSDLFDGNRWKNGNGFLLYEVARGLDPNTPHLLEIEPVFDDAKAQELKLESLCVAGGKATVPLLQKAAEYGPH